MSDPQATELARRIRVARGEEPGDLLLRGGKVVNVFTGRVETADVVVAGGRIAGVGPYDWEAASVEEIGGRVVLPGLIDAHIHVESTMLMPAELARLVVPRGTAALVADPHEIANVLGIPGVQLLIDASAGLPLDIHYMAPSCVPATGREHAGAALGPAEVGTLLDNPAILGLAEMMNFPGVLAGDPDVLAKLAEARRRFAIVDGHAPGVSGRDLVAYAAAGIRSDHESVEADEAASKGALGMLVQVREGSSARNLDAMLPAIVDDRLGDWCLCSDDLHADDLVGRGHLEALLRRVVAAGVEPARAVRHATLVPARHYGLEGRGAVAPSCRADLLVVADLGSFEPALVVKDGAVVARDGRYLHEAAARRIEPANTVRLGALDESAFALDCPDGSGPVIGIVPDQIVTRRLERIAPRSNGRFAFDPDQDVVLIASLERHHASGRVGLGLVEGFGFRRDGAIGSSVAHDSHNLIVAGTNARDMLACARALEASGGGLAVARDGALAARLPLAVAGLISTAGADDVCRGLAEVREAAMTLGIGLAEPFGTLSFLALPVIPELRITDQGLFDVVRQEFARPA